MNRQPIFQNALLRCCILLLFPACLWAQNPFTEQVLNRLSYRNVGPFRQGGWIVDLAVPDSPEKAHLYTLYAATRNGGLYKTTNNGVTWRSIFNRPDVHALGAVAVAPSDGQVVWLGTGDSYYARSSYPGNGVYKSTDGGKKWQKLGGGLPAGKIGRIGLDVCRSNPNIVYAVVENVNLRDPLPAEIEQEKKRNIDSQPRPVGGEVYRSENGGKTWRKMNRPEDNVGGKAAYSFNTLRIDPNDDRKVYVTGLNLQNTTDGGLTWHGIEWIDTSKVFNSAFGDVRTAWIDPRNSQRIIIGSDGGVHISYDGGKTWESFQNNMPTVPVHDLVVHPRENDLVVGTYGRSLFITNISPLQEWKNNILGKDLYLFEIAPKPWRREGVLGANYFLYGDRHLSTSNEHNGLTCYFFLKEISVGVVQIKITDSAGRVVTGWEQSAVKGLNRAEWDLRHSGPGYRRPLTDPGDYTFTITHAGRSEHKTGKFTKVIGWKTGDE